MMKASIEQISPVKKRLTVEVEAQEVDRKIEEAYREHRSWKKVAEALGVDRTTIFRKATRYHIAEQ